VASVKWATQTRGFKMFWKIYNKRTGIMVEKVWYTLATTAEEVYAQLEYEFDFDILVVPDSED
jgi:hypothetical protein